MFEDLARAGRLLFCAGLNDSHSGNISVRKDNKIFITAKDAMLSDLKESDIIEVDLNDDAGDARASRDLMIHRELYRLSNAQSVVHAHPPNALALCVTENKILPQDAKGQAYFPQGVSIIKARQGADRDEIAKMLVQSIGQAPWAAMVKGVGSYALAASVNEALELTTSLELSAKIWLATKLVSARQQPQQQSSPHSSQHNRHYDHQKRSAIPPGIGVMGRRTGGYSRRDIKR